MRSIHRSLVLLFLAAIAGLADDSVSRFAPFQGMRVHYENYGSGDEALVFIHGWTCDLTFWRAQEPVYTSHRSLLIDLPGHGESDMPHIAYPVELFARGIEAVMRDAGVGHAVLIGHSLGGPIAYAFLRLYPEKVKALVLVDAYVSPPPRVPAGRAEQNARVESQRIRYAARSRNLQGPNGAKSFTRQIEAMFSGKTSEELRGQIREKMLATPEYVRAAAVTSPSQLPLPKPGTTFDLPAIALEAGAPSVQAGIQERFAAMRSLFPQLHLDRWVGHGHFLMMEDPERFNQALETFLAAVN